MNFYCISVKTGMEEKYTKNAQEILDDPRGNLDGTIHFLRKKMRLKTGKEYFEPFFPGYVFFETAETDFAHFKVLEYDKNFLRFLPSNQDIEPLANSDLNIVSSILSFGSTVGILSVTFDEGDRIVITDGSRQRNNHNNWFEGPEG